MKEKKKSRNQWEWKYSTTKHSIQQKKFSGWGGLQRYEQLESSNGLDLIDTAEVMMMRVLRDLGGV